MKAKTTVCAFYVKQGQELTFADTLEINFGARAQFLSMSYFDAFMVEPPVEETAAPAPSGAMQKRKNAQHKFDCPTGQTYCWTGERQEYACMDTSSDVTGTSPSTYLFLWS
jgi:hypothetical protein